MVFDIFFCIWLNTNLSDLIIYADNNSSSVSVPANSTIDIYYTQTELATHDYLALTPIELGDDRVHVRGVRADIPNQRIYIQIANPTTVSVVANMSFRMAFVKRFS